VLAIRAEIPVAILTDTIAQFPTFSEAFGVALRAVPPESQLADHGAGGNSDREEDEVVTT
jgi:hypothetical protein